MKSLRFALIAAVYASAILSAGPSSLVAPSAEAATVFSNYNGVICNCGEAGPQAYAAGFTSPGEYDVTGAAAFVQNSDFLEGAAQPFSLVLYSATAGGSPGAALWTSGTVFAPGPNNTSTLVAATYSGAPIVLQAGSEYFFGVSFPNGNVVWLSDGTTSVPLYGSGNGGATWSFVFDDSVQFEVYGARVPEPSTWAMMLIGFAGLGFAGYWASRKSAALAAS
jgi:hypothetical protein